MTQLLLFSGAAFLLGFILAWILRSLALAKTNKVLKSTQGFLESEKLVKETLQKENAAAYLAKEIAEFELNTKLKQAQELNKVLDENILLLQKSNEETEALLLAGEPAIHGLKLKLIEANNTIARYKAQLPAKEKSE